MCSAAVLSNNDLATFETCDEWVTSRPGIKERRICHCNFSDMALVAARRALAAADLDANEFDLILLGSLTNDSMCPNTASLVADALGARNAAAWTSTPPAPASSMGYTSARIDPYRCTSKSAGHRG